MWDVFSIAYLYSNQKPNVLSVCANLINVMKENCYLSPFNITTQKVGLAE